MRAGFLAASGARAALPRRAAVARGLAGERTHRRGRAAPGAHLPGPLAALRTPHPGRRPRHLAGALSGGRLGALELSWHMLRSPHTAGLRTARTSLSALPGVFCECWRLERLSTDEFDAPATWRRCGEVLPPGALALRRAACDRGICSTPAAISRSCSSLLVTPPRPHPPVTTGGPRSTRSPSRSSTWSSASEVEDRAPSRPARSHSKNAVRIVGLAWMQTRRAWLGPWLMNVCGRSGGATTICPGPACRW